MPGARKYNYERYPVGTRIRVHCTDPHEGTDREWHGHVGTIMAGSTPSQAEVFMDKRKRNWPNPVIICWHNLVALSQGAR